MLPFWRCVQAFFLMNIIYLQIVSALPTCLSFRSLPPRGINHSLLPSPPLLPTPSFYLPMGAPLHHSYRWAPPHPDCQWRRPSRSEDSRSRFSPYWSLSLQRQEDRRRGPRPPPPLPQYCPRWSSDSIWVHWCPWWEVGQSPNETWPQIYREEQIQPIGQLLEPRNQRHLQLWTSAAHIRLLYLITLECY